MTNVYQLKPQIVNDKMVGGKYDGLPTYRVPDSYLEEFGFLGDAAAPVAVITTTEGSANLEAAAVDEAAAAGIGGSADPIPETSSGVE